MDWRSFSKTLLSYSKNVVLLCALALFLVACGRNAVRATEKEFLADRIMVFDEDGQEASADDHVLSNREGSIGGRGTGGGGCGCN